MLFSTILVLFSTTSALFSTMSVVLPPCWSFILPTFGVYRSGRVFAPTWVGFLLFWSFIFAILGRLFFRVVAGSPFFNVGCICEDGTAGNM